MSRKIFPVKPFVLPRDEAIKFMEEKGEPYKVELIEDLPDEETISFYTQGEFYGPVRRPPYHVHQGREGL